ncbi:hypothetical protein PENSPDRAFT_670070 [Peniophora sp. CONT]|nr:hypothetical protein PENSPDRAFT_670070 [Peniophora sp. CONT]
MHTTLAKQHKPTSCLPANLITDGRALRPHLFSVPAGSYSVSPGDRKYRGEDRSKAAAAKNEIEQTSQRHVSHPTSRDLILKALVYPYTILPNDTKLHDNFLAHLTDKAGSTQSILWPIADMGVAKVGTSTIVFLQVNRNVECFGRVERLLGSDSQDAIVQVRLLGWNTLYGWKAPEGNLISLAVVSRERLSVPYHKQAAYRQFAHNITLHTINAINMMHRYLVHQNMAWVPTDPIALALMDAFIESPSMRYFSTTLGTGCAYVYADRKEKLGVSIPEPPAMFDSMAGYPPYLRDVPDSADAREKAHPSHTS